MRSFFAGKMGAVEMDSTWHRVRGKAASWYILAVKEGIGLPTHVLGCNEKLEGHSSLFTIAQNQH